MRRKHVYESVRSFVLRDPMVPLIDDRYTISSRDARMQRREAVKHNADNDVLTNVAGEISFVKIVAAVMAILESRYVD